MNALYGGALLSLLASTAIAQSYPELAKWRKAVKEAGIAATN